MRCFAPIVGSIYRLQGSRLRCIYPKPWSTKVTAAKGRLLTLLPFWPAKAAVGEAELAYVLRAYYTHISRRVLSKLGCDLLETVLMRPARPQ
jgi:hypothetical protein